MAVRGGGESCCGRQSRVVLAPVAGVKFVDALAKAYRTSLRNSSTGDGDKRNSSPGRARNKPLKPLRRECRVSGVPVVTTVCIFAAHGLRVPRAPGISLRPLLFWANAIARLGRMVSREMRKCAIRSPAACRELQ